MISSEVVKKAKSHIQKTDPILWRVVTKTPDPTWSFGNSYFYDLTEQIISQQLSIKAADTIFARFKKLFKNELINQEDIINFSEETLRGVGISYQKISYLKDLAEKTRESGILFKQFEIMTDEEIIAELTKVKGIGRWTAEMFLMFTMGRVDVFSYGDLGIRKAIAKLYGLKNEPTEKQARHISEKWRPYRTIACRYLWKSNEL